MSESTRNSSDLSNRISHLYTVVLCCSRCQTLSRKRGSLSGGFYAGSNGCGGLAYEPHLDADSGDSGRGPSEEGNQLLMADQYRNGHVIATGHPYNTYAGYRPSSRQGGYRPNMTMEMTGSGNMLKLHALNCPGTSPGGSCGCYILSDPQDGSIVSSNVQWATSNGMEMTDPYGTHYAPNYPICRPLPVPGGAPPLPPPRSPTVSEPHTGSTLRRPNPYRLTENGTSDMVTGSTDPSGYPTESYMNYGQMNCPASGMTTAYTHDSRMDLEGESGSHGSNGPPVRIDLRQTSQERNGSLGDADPLDSKSRARLVQMGLPPLATKQALVNSGSANGTDERADSMDPLNATCH
ncbi:hypothetical protein D915_007603 [Fasciola hepatica]|uniref:Uncharacterized protein n=1 Tax=Fasciola hepatica TaxID=6192 RepID=A0A4E0R0E5_FASHE|nr:hypothetical protein D915_007603 [Fasciola hepatica]